MGVGPAEGIIVLFSLIVPIAVLVWLVVSVQGIKASLKRIERILEQKDDSRS